jgi:signal transduction histidine kinase
MDAQRGPMHQDLPDLSDLALDVVACLAPLAVRQNYEMETGEPPEVIISGDRQALTQMFPNVVEDAIMYTAQNATDPLRHILVSIGMDSLPDI